MIGHPLEIILFSLTALIGTMALAAGAQGYLIYKISWIYRILLIISALLLIHPNLLTDAIGLVLLGGVFAQQLLKRKGRLKAEQAV